MRVEIVKEREDYIEFSMFGEDQSILDALSEVLQSIEGVEYAGHKVMHPLTGEVRIVIKTKVDKIKARDALINGLERLGGMLDEILSMLERI